MGDIDADDLAIITRAGQRYLAQMGATDEPERELLLALGATEVGAIGHRRAVRLGLAVVRRPLARWSFPAIGPVDEIDRSLRVPVAFLLGSPVLSAEDLAHACHIDQGFINSAQCSEEESYVRAIYLGVAALSRFTLYAGLPDGVDVLEWSRLADGEEYERLPCEMCYENWLIEIALPAAYRELPLSKIDLNPRWIGTG